MLKAALISLGSTSSKWTYEAMKKYFDVVDNLDLKKVEVSTGKKGLEVLYDGKELSNYDCVFAKGSFRYKDVLRGLTGALYNKCYMPLQAKAFTTGHDKILTHMVLQAHKIPMPKTYITPTISSAKSILKRVNYPIIMKFPQGTGGKGVMFADSFASASSILDALSTLNQPFLIQEYIETEGTDIRVIVAGDKVIAAMKRVAESDEKRANIHAGGKGEAFIHTSKIKKMSIEVAKAIGADICAIDILDSGGNPQVIEVNLSPGLQGITKATKIDVANEIAKFLYKKTKEITTVKRKNGTSQILKEEGIEENGQKLSQDIITNLDFRANRILMPEVVTDISKFNEKKEVVIKVEKGKIIIEEFKLG